MELNTDKLTSNLLTSKNKPNKPELTIILPCRNEELALPYCLNQIKEVIKQHNLDAELIISDSSTDNSLEAIKQFAIKNPNKLKIKIVKHDKIGYGNAYLEAFPHISGNYIFMADADASYDFTYIPTFIKELKENDYDFVIGNRFAEKIEPGIMPWSHKYIGNPLLSGLLRSFYKTDIKDCHCGMRAIKTDCLNKLNLETTGMEFASEMIIKASKNNLKIKQLPISYKKRLGKSKLKTFSDGWRHLKFILLTGK